MPTLVQYTENVVSDTGKEDKDMIFQPGQKVISEHYAGDVYISGLLRNTGYDICQLWCSRQAAIMTGISIPMLLKCCWYWTARGIIRKKGSQSSWWKKWDVIKTFPNVKHWHGATPESRLVHLSITDGSEKEHIQWCEQFPERPYHRPVLYGRNQADGKPTETPFVLPKGRWISDFTRIWDCAASMGTFCRRHERHIHQLRAERKRGSTWQVGNASHPPVEYSARCKRLSEVRPFQLYGREPVRLGFWTFGRRHAPNRYVWFGFSSDARPA